MIISYNIGIIIMMRIIVTIIIKRIRIRIIMIYY
jgi:hypothetical protein